MPIKVDHTRRFNLPATLAGSVQATVLADTGSQGMFMGFERATALQLPIKQLTRPDSVSFANPALGEAITSYVTCRVAIGSYWKDLNFMLANIGDSVILGVPWFDTLLIDHLDWQEHQLSFRDKLTDRHHRLDLRPAPPTSTRFSTPSRIKEGTGTHPQVLPLNPLGLYSPIVRARPGNDDNSLCCTE